MGGPPFCHWRCPGPRKSYWYLVEVGPNGKYISKAKQPGSLFLCNNGQSATIERLEVSEARETLGIWSPPDGLMIDEVNALKSKALKWAPSASTPPKLGTPSTTPS